MAKITGTTIDGANSWRKFGSWIEGLGDIDGATVLVGVASLIVVVGIRFSRSKVPGALVLVVGVLIFETLMQAFVRRLDSQLKGRTPASDAPKLPDVVARCIRVAVLLGVTVTIAETWVVEAERSASKSRT